VTISAPELNAHQNHYALSAPPKRRSKKSKKGEDTKNVIEFDGGNYQQWKEDLAFKKSIKGRDHASTSNHQPLRLRQRPQRTNSRHRNQQAVD
jgi:hypothetical protein